MKNKHLPLLLVGLLASAGFVGEASAASLIDAAGATAITSGYTDLSDTVKQILTLSWPWILGISALLASPRIVKGMFKTSTGK